MSHSKINIPLLLVHLSFLFIIAGGICTAISSKHGTLYLQPSSTTNSYISDDGKLEKLPAPVTLLSFTTEYYPDSGFPKDYRSEVLVANSDTMHISMNHIGRYKNYRFYQNSFDDQGGSILTVNYDPIGIPIVYAGFLLFATGGIAYLIRNYHTSTLVAFGFLLVTWLISVTWLRMKNSSMDPVLPVLDSWWLPVHVSLIIVAYIMLALTMPMAIAALLLPHKREQLLSNSIRLIAPGVYMLGLGIIAGAMWANVSWGRYWGWDPKETWALITMLLFSIPLHRCFRFRKHPKACAIFLILVFLSIPMTYFGVNYLDSLHAYN